MIEAPNQKPSDIEELPKDSEPDQDFQCASILATSSLEREDHHQKLSMASPIKGHVHSHQRLHRAQSVLTTVGCQLILSELTSTELFSPEGCINNIFEQSHSPFNISWAQTDVTPQEGKFIKPSPITFDYSFNDRQYHEMEMEDLGRCSDFLIPLEDAFPNEPQIMPETLKDIQRLGESQKKMAPVPTFDENLISTKDVYQHLGLTAGNAASQIIKSQLAPVNRFVRADYGKTLNVTKKLKLLANTYKKSRETHQTHNKRAIKTQAIRK